MHVDDFRSKREELSRLSKIFSGKKGLNNYWVIRTLALSDGPLTRTEIGIQIRSEDTGQRIESPRSTYDRRVDALSELPKPPIHVVGEKRSRRGRRAYPTYDLTLRGGIIALVLMTGEGELFDYSKRLGWGLKNPMLETLKRLANFKEDDSHPFWPIVKAILSYFQDEFTSGLVNLDTSNDYFISIAIRKNLLIIMNRLEDQTESEGLIQKANDWLQSQGCLRLPSL